MKDYRQVMASEEEKAVFYMQEFPVGFCNPKSSTLNSYENAI